MSIDTLIADMYSTLTTKGWLSEELAQSFSSGAALRLQDQFNGEGSRSGLRLSKVGPWCPRQLWYSVHLPGLAEPPPAWVMNKFSYGHIIEHWALTLAKASGHDVRGEQDVLYVEGVSGHRDCVIDGCLVDVKSVNSRGYATYEDKSLGTSDTFGVLDQLDAYLVGCAEDPLVTVKDRAYLLGVDKVLGHMVLYEHQARLDRIRDRIVRYKEIVALPEAPKCECGLTTHKKSGNLVLDLRASYSDYKHICFPNLVTGLYSGKPVYIVKMVSRPEIIIPRKEFTNEYSN